MRWLAKRWLRGMFLEFGEGRCLYYPVFATGPGFIVAADKWRAFEGYVALLIWLPVVCFAAPKRFLALWLGELFGPFFESTRIAWGLWLLVLGPLFWLILHRGTRALLESCDRRDPADWDADLKRLEAGDGIGWIELAVCFPVLMFLGTILGIALDEALLFLLGP